MAVSKRSHIRRIRAWSAVLPPTRRRSRARVSTASGFIRARMNAVVASSGVVPGARSRTAATRLSAGHAVAIVGRDPEKLAAASERNGAYAISADLGVLAGVDQMIAEVGARFGRIDVLFANAGTADAPPVAETTEADFDRIVALNVKSVFFTVVRSLPLMPDDASVVVTSTAAEARGRPGSPLYLASKAAVRSLVRSLALARRTGAGSMHALGDNRAILSQRGADGSIRVYFALHIEEDPTRTRGDLLTGLARPWVRDQFVGWAPELLDVVDQVDTEFAYWPLHGMPARQQWRPHSGVTLLGDAAHVMPPFSGEGVNMALLDTVELVDALFGPGTVDEAISRYETAMLARMREAVAASAASREMVLNPRGTEPLLARING
jgi:NAD(P)-dependent dehydrogenase (short-subunit alcohol dehydrogenase family)